MNWKRYKKKHDYSYALGAFPSLEIIEHRQDQVLEVIFSSDFNEIDTCTEKLESLNIEYRVSDRMINKLAKKGNQYVICIFKKWDSHLEDTNHVLLDNISDMGNLGNIMRTLLAMDIKNLALVGNSCDVFNPKTVRASMGAIARINIEHFDTIYDYMKAFPLNIYNKASERKAYSFLLDEKAELLPQVKKSKPWTLCFGNEASGLPKEYAHLDQNVIIPQSEAVDSLNLSTAVAIALYEFKNH